MEWFGFPVLFRAEKMDLGLCVCADVQLLCEMYVGM